VGSIDIYKTMFYIDDVKVNTTTITLASVRCGPSRAVTMRNEMADERETSSN